MPEIGEIARVVHYLKKHALGKTIAKVQVQEDDIIYGKVGTSASAFQKAMTGKKIIGARQQGKYFWLEMSSPPHPLMHLGMTGWVKFSNDDSSYYKPAKDEEQQWPPRFWKFILELKEDQDTQVAFVDPRRLGRIRLVDVDATKMRNTTPLKENGPDPVIDKEILTVEWLTAKLRSKRVPVKALMLDQANISGVGNWVADEVLYGARIHPEQYSNTLSDPQIKTLHESLINVCTIACETLSDSSKFPDNWLMKHRWGKGKKDGGKLPSGEKIVFLTVGGRTSAVVPSVQKKTGPVAGDVDGDGDTNEKETKLKGKGAKRKVEQDQEKEEDRPSTTQANRTNKASKSSETPDKAAKKQKVKSEAKTESTKKGRKSKETTNGSETTRRRSTRLSGA
ncbi:hypothetical protein EJ05DRAFT_472754 [Pseudovirgaria hyperparasitica]|uniref:Formamidopyrimidine-DNA glycosylase catalytic domain-containing protein n=1 Tax=Pseudovirgaria hyperparasitica TaxID=470096 RepID=A0A6A6WHS8_9PEZI|nr:uncharacterized protein EJ05DRAFT_472754 [Pseudovirgaria hyperparasitica]KAF2761789.1 hypothetical protein EJ05DRAFT_472754 [Pseudovirgaria hyperparasitica]